MSQRKIQPQTKDDPEQLKIRAIKISHAYPRLPTFSLDNRFNIEGVGVPLTF